jgi:hypothetical protein
MSGLPTGPGWRSGPAPLPAPGEARAATVHDAETRRTYLENGPADVLYGATGNTVRWHSEQPSAEFLGSHADTVELLRLPGWLRAGEAVGVVHVRFDTDADPVDRLVELTVAAEGDSDLRRSVDRLFQPAATLLPGRQRAFVVGFVSFPAGPVRRMGTTYDRWPPIRQWLWGLASGTTEERFPPDPEDDSPFAGTVYLSADWRALVLRDGAAFVALRSHDPAEPNFLNLAERIVHSVYTDIFVLGFAQRHALHMYANLLATQRLHDLDASMLTELEQGFTRVRTTLWWEKVTSRGVGNMLLQKFQDQNGLGSLLTRVREDLTDAARLVQTESAGRQDATLGALTILGLPFGVAFAVGSILGNGVGIMLWCLAISVLLVCALHAAQGVRDLTRQLLIQVIGRSTPRRGPTGPSAS